MTQALTTPGLETISQFAAVNAQLNQYPSTPWQVRGLHRNREAHGLKSAFVKSGRRVLVNRVIFYELLNQGAPKPAPPPFVPRSAPTKTLPIDKRHSRAPTKKPRREKRRDDANSPSSAVNAPG